MDARTKKLTDANYSPTIPNSEEDIRSQIDGSIQEVYDIVDEAKLDKTSGDFLGSWHGIEKPVYAEPGLAGVVDGIDTALTSHKAESAYIINVLGEGVKGDDSTDDTEAIITACAKAALFKAAGYKVTLVFPPCKGFKTTGTITIESGINVLMDSPIKYYGVANIPALVIGESGVANYANLKLNVIRNTQSDWTNESCIGIQIKNLMSDANCRIDASGNFTIGTQFLGIQQGVSYNVVHLGELYNNKYGLDLVSDSTGGSGWVNENLFLGGRFSCFTGIGVGHSRYGIRIRSAGGAYISNNNNIFHKPSFELNATVAGVGEAVPILIEDGNGNRFYDCRSELNSTTFMRCTNQSSNNFAHVGYGLIANLDDQSVYPSNFITLGYTEANEYGKEIFNSGALHKNACYYDGATKINIPKVHISASSGGGVLTNNNGINLAANYLELDKSFGRAVGIFVDTTIQKRFVVRKDVESGYGGRIAIRCYDAAGTVLDNAGAGHPYVKGRASNVPTYNTAYGKTYYTGVDTEADFYFEVGTDVKQIAILLANGTESLRIRNFVIYSLNGVASTWVGYEEIIPGANLGTAAPTAGTWAVGRRVINAVPTVGQPKAWICTVEGTMGTLSGVTGSITSGTAALTVNTTTGLTVGNYITIAGVTGTKKIIAIVADLVVTLDSNADATVSDAAVAYSNGTWVSEGNL